MIDQEEKYDVDPRARNFETIREDEVNLYDLWKVILKRKMIIIAIFLISLLGAAIYCFAASPIYRLETHMKLYMPKDIVTVKELPTAKDISSIIGKIDDEKMAIIFSKNADEITQVNIDEIKGTTDKFRIIIESHNPESLGSHLQEMLSYIENIREIKSNHEKIISEIHERMQKVQEADSKNDFHIREIEKRLHSSKLLPVGFNPVEINNKAVELKMEKYRLEKEFQNYKTIQPLEDPFISRDPVKPKKAIIMTIAGACSLMFGILVAFFVEYLAEMRKKTLCR